MARSDSEMANVKVLGNMLGKLLAGHPPDVQGAVLADALAMWLAGHHVPGDEDATRSMRAELLAVHCGMVRELVPVNARIIGTTP